MVLYKTRTSRNFVNFHSCHWSNQFHLICLLLSVLGFILILFFVKVMLLSTHRWYWRSKMVLLCMRYSKMVYYYSYFISIGTSYMLDIWIFTIVPLLYNLACGFILQSTLLISLHYMQHMYDNVWMQWHVLFSLHVMLLSMCRSALEACLDIGSALYIAD